MKDSKTSSVKKSTTFIQFNIMEFYSSISRELLHDSLNHAWKYIDIPDKEINIILTCRKSIPMDSGKTWVKSHTDNFNISMGT